MLKRTATLFLMLMVQSAAAAGPKDETEHLKWLFEVNAMHVAAAAACDNPELGARLYQSTMELFAVHPLIDPAALGVNERSFDNKVSSYVGTSRQFTLNDKANCPKHLSDARVRVSETDALIVRYLARDS